jgi:glutamyl-tRNA reductase
MTELWALTASAADVDAATRDRLSRRIDEWLAAGNDGVVLTTCHRVELYGIGSAPDLDGPVVRRGPAAVSHLMRVAAGLESAIVGEDEVLHQVRDALRHVHESGPLDSRLRRLFETAIAAGRRARSGRTESSGSLAQNAVSWLRGRSRLAGRMVVVAGAGRMGAALARSLAHAGAEVVVASRDANRAAKLARLYGGRGASLSGGAELTAEAAGVAVALGGVWRELESGDLRELPPVADISAPQAVPDSVRRRLNGGFLGIDDLYVRSGTLPGAYMRDAEAVVRRRTDEYLAWLGRVG